MQVSITTPPAMKPGMEYWERTVSPNPNSVKAGWMAIDWSEDPQGFVADGEEVTGVTDYLFSMGPYGRTAAYPNTPAGVSLINAHQKLYKRKA